MFMKALTDQTLQLFCYQNQAKILKNLLLNFPKIINADQTGFIRNHYGSDKALKDHHVKLLDQVKLKEMEGPAISTNRKSERDQN